MEKSKVGKNEMKADLNLLLECLKCQLDCPSALKQALVTISSVCIDQAGSKEYLRESGGLQFILNLATSTGYTEVEETAIYTIGCAVEGNVFSQKLVNTRDTFMYLHGCLSGNHGRTKLQQTATFCMLNLVANNGQGQMLMRKSGCLQLLLNLFKNTLTTDDFLDYESEKANVQLWTSVCSALCVGVNNPQNEDNQRLCASGFPYALKCLEEAAGIKIVRSAASFISVTVANNVHNQDRMSKCDGMTTLINVLYKVINRTRSNLHYLQLAAHISKALDACVADNVENAKICGDLGLIPLLLKLMAVDSSDIQLKLQTALTIGHCTDICAVNQKLLIECGGINILIQQMTESVDDETSKAIRYVLQTCVNNDDTQPMLNADMMLRKCKSPLTMSRITQPTTVTNMSHAMGSAGGDAVMKNRSCDPDYEVEEASRQAEMSSALLTEKQQLLQQLKKERKLRMKYQSEANEFEAQGGGLMDRDVMTPLKTSLVLDLQTPAAPLERRQPQEIDSINQKLNNLQVTLDNLVNKSSAGKDPGFSGQESLYPRGPESGGNQKGMECYPTMMPQNVDTLQPSSTPKRWNQEAGESFLDGHGPFQISQCPEAGNGFFEGRGSAATTSAARRQNPESRDVFLRYHGLSHFTSTPRQQNRGAGDEIFSINGPSHIRSTPRRQNPYPVSGDPSQVTNQPRMQGRENRYEFINDDGPSQVTSTPRVQNFIKRQSSLSGSLNQLHSSTPRMGHFEFVSNAENHATVVDKSTKTPSKRKRAVWLDLSTPSQSGSLDLLYTNTPRIGHSELVSKSENHATARNQNFQTPMKRKRAVWLDLSTPSKGCSVQSLKTKGSQVLQTPAKENRSVSTDLPTSSKKMSVKSLCNASADAILPKITVVSSSERVVTTVPNLPSGTSRKSAADDRVSTTPRSVKSTRSNISVWSAKKGQKTIELVYTVDSDSETEENDRRIVRQKKTPKHTTPDEDGFVRPQTPVKRKRFSSTRPSSHIRPGTPAKQLFNPESFSGKPDMARKRMSPSVDIKSVEKGQGSSWQSVATNEMDSVGNCKIPRKCNKKSASSGWTQQHNSRQRADKDKFSSSVHSTDERTESEFDRFPQRTPDRPAVTKQNANLTGMRSSSNIVHQDKSAVRSGQPCELIQAIENGKMDGEDDESFCSAESQSTTVSTTSSSGSITRVSDEKCPGCQPVANLNVPTLNSRTYNITLETCPYTCRIHRRLRSLEREFMEKKSEPAKTLSTCLSGCSESKVSRSSRSVYDFPLSSESDSAEQVSPLHEVQWEPYKQFQGKDKRKKRRPRVPYTEEELRNLKDGVKKMGRFWNQIFFTYKFHPSRTPVDLMEKWKRIQAKDRKKAEKSPQCNSKVPFSMCEERRLLRGVKIYGYNWKTILVHFKFHRQRTAEQLRWKWRNINKQKD